MLGALALVDIHWTVPMSRVRLQVRAYEPAAGVAASGGPVAALVALGIELTDNHGQTNRDP
jgi:hypothetical protein